MRDMLAARWAEIGDKVVQLAEAVPEHAYDRRPAAEVRSFAEQLRHVAFWNLYARDTLRGGAPDGEANALPADVYATKTRIVDALRDSFADVGAEIARRDAHVDAGDVETIVSYLGHAAEHYGQLAVYARLAGVVPPASVAVAA
jgi:uncharacterized damage-inducible protein DinB